MSTPTRNQTPSSGKKKKHGKPPKQEAMAEEDDIVRSPLKTDAVDDSATTAAGVTTAPGLADPPASVEYKKIQVTYSFATNPSGDKCEG